MNKSTRTKNKLIKIFGSPSCMAISCGVKPQDVNNWFNRGFPKSSLTRIEKEVKKRDGNITVYDLIAYSPEAAQSTASEYGKPKASPRANTAA